jgi:Zn-dependent M32 family carboxypeptidase
MGRQLNLLKQRLEEIRHINKASALLIWDQETKCRLAERGREPSSWQRYLGWATSCLLPIGQVNC